MDMEMWNMPVIALLAMFRGASSACILQVECHFDTWMNLCWICASSYEMHSRWKETTVPPGQSFDCSLLLELAHLRGHLTAGDGQRSAVVLICFWNIWSSCLKDTTWSTKSLQVSKHGLPRIFVSNLPGDREAPDLAMLPWPLRDALGQDLQRNPGAVRMPWREPELNNRSWLLFQWGRIASRFQHT